MILSLILLCAILAACNVQAKAVFAHFMVGNTESFGVSDWATNIRLAHAAHIDAFGLNIAHGWGHNDDQIKNAFDAAASDPEFSSIYGRTWKRYLVERSIKKA